VFLVSTITKKKLTNYSCSQPFSTLINGKGRYLGGPLVPLSVINVQKGKRYRFRLVSLSCDPNFQFSIEGHDLTIIAIDGVNVLPKTVDSIQIFAGQRYDFVARLLSSTVSWA
jgi:iron transport multicopper oxidase